MIRTIKGLAVLLAMLTLLSGCGYNAMQAADEQVDAAWAEVLNQYQRRADLVPNLVNSVKGYAAHEAAVMKDVTEARARLTQQPITQTQPDDAEAVARFDGAQRQLGSALQHLLVIAENYPDLKASGGFRDLQVQLEGTENRIAVARGRYITAVREYNVLLRQFPGVVTAKLMGYQPKANFSVQDEAALAQPPAVDFVKP